MSPASPGGNRAGDHGGEEPTAHRTRRGALPTRRLGPLLVLALAVVLAGCGGAGVVDDAGGADGGPTDTVTPAPVPTATADTYPPGVSGRYVEPEVIGTTMRTTLRGTSYTWTLEERGLFETRSNGTDYVGSRIDARVAGPTQYVIDQVLLVRDSDETTRLSTSYVNGSIVMNYDGENVTGRPVSSAQFGYSSRVAANVAGYLQVSSFETTRLPNGSVRVRGTDSTRRGFSNYSVVARIDPDGVIRRLNATFTRDGRIQTVEFRLDRDYTFEPPPWADEDVVISR